MQKTLITIIAALGFAAALYAATPVATVNAEISYLIVTGEPMQISLGEKPTANVMASLRTRSLETHYRGTTDVLVYGETPTATRGPIAQLTLPHDFKRGLVFLVKMQGGTWPYAAYAVPLDPSRDNDANQVIVCNATRATLAIQLGQQQWMQIPGGSNPMNVAAYGIDEVNFRVGVNISGEWRKMADSLIQFAPGKRAYILIQAPRTPTSPVLPITTIYEEIPTQLASLSTRP